MTDNSIIKVRLNCVYKMHGKEYHRKLVQKIAEKQVVLPYPISDGRYFTVHDLHLCPEPTNRYDPDAVKVLIDKTGTTLGYISKATNKLLKGISVRDYKIDSIEVSEDQPFEFDLTLVHLHSITSDDVQITLRSYRNTTELLNKKYTIINANEETEKMKMNANLKNMFFREVNNVVIDLMTGSMGFTAEGNTCTFVNGAVVVNPITDMAVTIPAFGMLTKISDLKVGDLVITGSSIGFFVSADAGSVNLMGAGGVTLNVTPTTNILFGNAGSVMAVRNMFSGAEAGVGGMNPMMAFALMGDKADGKDDMLKTMMLMQMMGGAQGGQMNPLMMMALMK